MCERGRGTCRRFRGSQRLDWAGQCLWGARGERGMRDGQRWQRHTFGKHGPSAHLALATSWWLSGPKWADRRDLRSAGGSGGSLGFGVSRRPSVWQIYMRLAVMPGLILKYSCMHPEARGNSSSLLLALALAAALLAAALLAAAAAGSGCCSRCLQQGFAGRCSLRPSAVSHSRNMHPGVPGSCPYMPPSVPHGCCPLLPT